MELGNGLRQTRVVGIICKALAFGFAFWGEWEYLYDKYCGNNPIMLVCFSHIYVINLFAGKDKCSVRSIDVVASELSPSTLLPIVNYLLPSQTYPA
jgi:hypothetical protein